MVVGEEALGLGDDPSADVALRGADAVVAEAGHGEGSADEGEEEDDEDGAHGGGGGGDP